MGSDTDRAATVHDAALPDALGHRILDGLAECIATHGYRNTTVVDVVRMAHTSKREFYQRFPNKQECFLALMEAGTAGLVARIREAVDPAAPWDHQVRQAIRAFVVSIQARPGLSVGWIRELPTLGIAGRPAQRRNFEQLTTMFVDLTENDMFSSAGIGPVSPQVAVMLLGGLRELAAQTVENGEDVRLIIEPATATVVATLAGLASRVDGGEERA